VVFSRGLQCYSVDGTGRAASMFHFKNSTLFEPSESCKANVMKSTPPKFISMKKYFELSL
jgi:hypothetical protein